MVSRAPEPTELNPPTPNPDPVSLRAGRCATGLRPRRFLPPPPAWCFGRTRMSRSSSISATFSTPRSASPSARCPTATFPWRTRRSRFSSRPRSFASRAASFFTTCSMSRSPAAWARCWRGGSRSPRCAGAWPPRGRWLCSSPRRSFSSASTASCPTLSTTATAASGCWSRCGVLRSSIEEKARPLRLPPAHWRAFPVLQAKHGPAVSAGGVGAVCSARLQPSAAQAKPGSFPFGTNAPCPSFPRCLRTRVTHDRSSPFLPARAPHCWPHCWRSIAPPVSATTFTGPSNMPGNAACRDSASCSASTAIPRSRGRCPASPSRWCSCGWDRNDSGRGSPPSPCSPRRFSSRSPRCCIYDDADERGDSLLALWPLLLLLAAALALANLFALALTTGRPCALFLPARCCSPPSTARFCRSSFGARPTAFGRCSSCSLAELLAFLGPFTARANVHRWFTPALAAIISITLLVCGGFYTASEERLSYANLPDGPPAHSAFPALAGLATPGPYLPEIDELLRYAQANIPFDDGIVLDSRRRTVLFRHRPRAAVPRAVLRSHHRSLFARRNRRARARTQHSLADCEDRRADQRRPHARSRGIDAAADAGVHARGAFARLRCVPALASAPQQAYAFFFAFPDLFNCSQSFTVWSA